MRIRIVGIRLSRGRHLGIKLVSFILVMFFELYLEVLICDKRVLCSCGD
jgi:hypothetical protein